MSDDGFCSGVQHSALALSHLHYEAVLKATAVLPPLDVRAARQRVPHHQNLDGMHLSFFFFF